VFIKESLALGVEFREFLIGHWLGRRRAPAFGLVGNFPSCAALSRPFWLPAIGQHASAGSNESCHMKRLTNLCPMTIKRFTNKIGLVGMQKVSDA